MFKTRLQCRQHLVGEHAGCQLPGVPLEVTEWQCYGEICD